MLGRYGITPPSALLRNDGRGHFRDVTAQVASELARVGMVTDAVWVDVDHDGRLDLVVVGEWMPIKVVHNTGTRLVSTTVRGLEHTSGFFFSSRRRHTRFDCDWSSDVCSSD